MIDQQLQLTKDIIKKGKLQKCECGCMLFDAYTAITKISAIISPSGQEIDIPMRVLTCKDCGTVPKWSDPDNLLPKEIIDAKSK